MNRHNILTTAFLLSLAASGSAETLNFNVAGVNRSVVLHVPISGLSSPALVFILHGLGGDGASMESTTRMDAVADREKFIVAYPSAVSGTWDYASTKNDYTFLLAIIDTAHARYNIDKNKVYVAGFSQGGGMTVYIGFQYPDVFAAIAPVSSVGSGAVTPKRPIPIFLTFGTGSDIYSAATFMSSVSGWLKIDSCTDSVVVTRPYPSSNAKSVVTRLSYSHCAEGIEIVVDSISGGSHEWPMDTATKVNNSEEVWAFFKKFTLGGSTVVRRQTIPVSHNCMSASCRSGIVYLHGAIENGSARVIDTRGKLVASATVVKSQFVFKNKPCGVYVVMIGGKEGFSSIRMVIP
jgi:poly(hydroxyalkanoate) depolymerase family esterase